MYKGQNKYIDHIVENYDNIFGCEILERYILEYIKISKKDNDASKLPKLLGELAVLYSDKSINKSNIKNFITKLIKDINHVNEFVITHIKNFFDIVIVNQPDLIFNYLDKINEELHDLSEDNISILSSAVVRGAMKLKLNINNLMLCIDYPWRSYCEISKYYWHFDNKDKALEYILKALKTCPQKLKDEYRFRRDSIISQT